MSTQHIATLLGGICCVRLATMLRRIATCWVLLAQVWSPGRNMSTPHVATLLSAILLCAFGRPVATCCDVLGVVSNLTSFKLDPTTPNMSQQGGHMGKTCCVQQCCDMLPWHVAIVWPGLYTVIKHDGHWEQSTRGKCRKHEAQASVFYISWVFSNVPLRLLHLFYDIGIMFYTLIKHGFSTNQSVRREISIF